MDDHNQKVLAAAQVLLDVCIKMRGEVCADTCRIDGEHSRTCTMLSEAIRKAGGPEPESVEGEP